MGATPRGLWRHPDFLKLWAGMAASDTGAAITTLALPLVAIVTLGAGPAQMGLLVALRHAPVPIFGLFAGVWIDRRTRRPLMIGTRLGYALLLATIPAAAFAGVLRIEQLYAVAFGLGTLAVVFDLAHTSYLPSLVERRELVEGNAKLQLTNSVAAVAGPGLGGVVVQALGAPVALAFDFFASLGAALGVGLIRAAEPARASGGRRAGLLCEIGAGLRLALTEPIISAMTICSTIGSLAGAMLQAVFLLFLSNGLGLSPAWIGAIVATAGGAALLGALLAQPAARRHGPGRVLVAMAFLWFVGALLIPLAGVIALPVVPVLMAAQLCLGLSLTVYSVNQISLRQAITPDELLGRVNASRRVLVFGAIPVGALIGGALGAALGLRATLVGSAGIAFVAFLYAAASPLRSVRSLPAVSAASGR